ncbi:MAG TPA: CHAT domain-containing protein [Nannocystaceae bacterium]|nr:CHAT domain-containing protein [Nannocystaceae bacterium]
MLSHDELRRFFQDAGVGEAIPGPGVSLAHLAFDGADALRRRGLIGEELFERLASHAGSRRDAVVRTACAFGFALRAPAKGVGSGARGAISESCTILFLAANALMTARLRLDEEAREIEERLLCAEHRDLFRVRTAWAARPRDIMEGLLRHQPRIVQFSSHGTPDGLWLSSPRDPEQGVRVSPDALAELFALHADTVQCVVLNACFSADQAEGIARHIDVVVGTEGTLDDESALVFSSTFYRTLAAGRDVGFAFRSAYTAVRMECLPGPSQFRLCVRPGVDPSALRLT